MRSHVLALVGSLAAATAGAMVACESGSSTPTALGDSGVNGDASGTNDAPPLDAAPLDVAPFDAADESQRGFPVLLFTAMGLTGNSVWDHRTATGCDPNDTNAVVDTQAAAVKELQRVGAERGWKVDVTSDGAAFTGGTIAGYRAVVFLLTSGDILDPAQRDGLQAYIHGGGGFVAVHSSSTNWSWQWFQDLCGGTFIDHPINPRVRTGRVLAGDAGPAQDPIAAAVPTPWTHSDEFHAFFTSAGQTTAVGLPAAPAANPATNPLLTVSLLLDETSLDLSQENADVRMGTHPLAWHHTFEGGRAAYSALGHCAGAYADPAFVEHLARSIAWAGGLL